MDSDIEIVEHDVLDNSRGPEINDFSQVKILVHGGDVAEKLIEDLVDLTEEPQEYHIEEHEEYHTEECEEYAADTEDLEETEDVLPEDYITISKDHTEAIIEENVKVIPEFLTEPHHYTDCSEVSIKEEFEQFDGTDFTDFNEAPEMCDNDLPPEDIYYYKNKIILGSRPCQQTGLGVVPTLPFGNDLPPEDIYHYKNKIILGSKPCQNKPLVSSQQKAILDTEGSFRIIDVCESNVISKEISVAVVFLEDWSLRLEQSSRFCKKCGILFPTSISLDAHNMSTHSLLVAITRNVAVKSTAKPAFARKSTSALVVKNYKNIARKSTGGNSILDSKFCNHCNKVFPDHTALIKHLYELIPQQQFKCNKCDAVFKTQKDLVTHNIVHMKPERFIKTEEPVIEATNFKRKLVYEEDLKKKRSVSPKKEVKLIPMSVLFQCIKCNIHFLTAFAGLQHWKMCNTATNIKISTCKTCKRKLRNVDIATHKKQHEICTKFKVYKITNNLYERTLCKCPKCGVHFKEITMKPHLKSCGKIPTTHCQKCKILIPKCKIEWHFKKHVKQNLKPKDFIVVLYYLQNKAVKRKLAPIATPAKKIKLEFQNSKIKKETPAGKSFPEKVSKKTNKEPNESIDNSIEGKKAGRKMKLINRLKFESGNKVRLYFCMNCSGCCTRDSYRKGHLSKQCMYRQKLQGRVICTKCGLQFTKKTILPHNNLHEQRNFTIHDIIFYHIGTLKPIIPSIPEYPQCNNCKIRFFSPTIQNEHICGEDYETCNVCSEKFHNSAYNIHMELHKLIKKPAPMKLGAKMLPQVTKKYISLNNMWNIVFCCSKCDVITDLYDKAIEHSQGHLGHEVSTKNIKCYICNLKFDETCWSKHSKLHSQMMISSKDLKILTYNPDKLLSDEWFHLFDSLPQQQIKQIIDRSRYGYERSVKMYIERDGFPEFTLYCCSVCKVCCPNNEIAKHSKTPCRNTANFCRICNIPFIDISALRNHEILHVRGVTKEEFRVVGFTKVKTKKITLEFKNSTPKFELFKCRKCNSCVRHRHNIVRHKCFSESRKTKCTKCNQFFNKIFIYKHNEEHRMHPEFTSKNIKVLLFDPPDKHSVDDEDDAFEPVKRKNKKFNTNKHSKQAKLVKSKAVTRKTAKTNISKAAEADTSITSKTESRFCFSNFYSRIAKVYKCDCGLHYTSVNTLEKHIEKRCPDYEISKENCSKCGLLFPTDILVSHLCKHHSKNTRLSVETYQKTEEAEESFNNVESTSAITKPRKNIKYITEGNTKLLSLNYKVKLYKCSECDIYFMAQNTCYKHIYKSHQRYDPKKYIECKLCGFQFSMRTLSFHVSIHHRDTFSLDNVLVEEYHPPVGKEPIKIEVYIASERWQLLQAASSIEESRFSNS